MPEVVKKKFIRIQASLDLWHVGMKGSFGTDFNKLTRDWRARSAFQINPADREKVYADATVINALNQLEVHKEKGALKTDIGVVLALLNLQRHALIDLMTAVRELVFEDIRVKEFDNLPSRMKCLYLSPVRPECVKYWWTEMESQGSDPARKIWEIEASGQAFTTPANLLVLHTFSIGEWELLARQYWAPHLAESPTDETLFIGDIEVITERDRSDFGIA